MKWSIGADRFEDVQGNFHVICRGAVGELTYKVPCNNQIY